MGFFRDLPRRPGLAVFAGGGAWLPRAGGGNEALVLANPCRVLVATAPDEVTELLEEVEAEQRRGRYVTGYLAYEAGAAFGLTVRPPAPDALPLAWMAVHSPESAILLSAAEWQRCLDEVEVEPIACALARVKPELSVSRDAYVEAITRVREYIAAGDTYQVNYTVRGRYELGPGDAAPAGAIDPLDYFLALVIRQPVPYAAYLDLGDAQVISLSPEMFLRRDAGRLESRPMKGTRPRGATHPEDVALAYELVETEKERAENLMIVDMVRNDLGRVCRAGSVRVPTLYAVEPYRTVWQMVSTVVGDVNPRAGLRDIMAAVFPGASITGAPKHHTMEIIAALESEPRDVYTGTVGLFSPGNDFTCSIAIRTIIHRQGHCKLGTGSGVVWDAAAEAEYDETLVKAAFATPPAGDTWRPNPVTQLRAAASASERLPQLARPARRGPHMPHAAETLRLFETILLEAREGDETVESPLGLAGLSPSLVLSDSAVLARYRYVDEHLRRMAASAQTLGLPFDRKAALELLIGHARLNPDALVVHLDLEAGDGFSVSTRPAPASVAAPLGAPAPPVGAGAPPVALMVSPFRTDPDDPFLRHKTSVRGFYNREYRRAVHEGCFDALFLNRLDHVTEGSITNVFARFNDRWVTPPLEDGLLPGIWRARYLAETGAREQSLTLDNLLAADQILVGNSVRGAIPVGRVLADPVMF